jgi:hypothetical protein
LAFPGHVHFGGRTRLLEKKAVERELLVLKFASQRLVGLTPAGIIQIIEKRPLRQ